MRQTVGVNLAQEDPAGGVPWGRPPVPGIPVPPFVDQAAARAFVENLCIYVAMLDDDGSVPLTTFGLLTVVHREWETARWACTFDPLPSRTVLTLAMVTYFPAPWTPAGLDDVMRQVMHPDLERRPVVPGILGWGSDPGFRAVRGAAGDWTVTSSERGTDSLAGRFAGDDDMVLYRMSFARSHPLPFGWGWDHSHADGLQRAATAARSAWSRHAELPYLSHWRD